jgi:hypothetical protein
MFECRKEKKEEKEKKGQPTSSPSPAQQLPLSFPSRAPSSLSPRGPSRPIFSSLSRPPCAYLPPPSLAVTRARVSAPFPSPARAALSSPLFSLTQRPHASVPSSSSPLSSPAQRPLRDSRRASPLGPHAGVLSVAPQKGEPVRPGVQNPSPHRQLNPRRRHPFPPPRKLPRPHHRAAVPPHSRPPQSPQQLRLVLQKLAEPRNFTPRPCITGISRRNRRR